jgi:hypothetical protein
MNTVIKSLFMPFVELYVDADFIMNLFYTSNIATVRRVTFQQDGNPYKKAYVDIYEWHDTEIAYNFIKRLHNPNVETKIIHSDDDWWIVKINQKREEFYYDHYSTHINYLIEDIHRSPQDEDDVNKVPHEEFKSNQKGMMLLAYIKNNAIKEQEKAAQIQDKEQDLKDWSEIEMLLDTVFKYQTFEFDLCI